MYKKQKVLSVLYMPVFQFKLSSQVVFEQTTSKAPRSSTSLRTSGRVKACVTNGGGTDRKVNVCACM